MVRSFSTAAVNVNSLNSLLLAIIQIGAFIRVSRQMNSNWPALICSSNCYKEEEEEANKGEMAVLFVCSALHQWPFGQSQFGNYTLYNCFTAASWGGGLNPLSIFCTDVTTITISATSSTSTFFFLPSHCLMMPAHPLPYQCCKWSKPAM